MFACSGDGRSTGPEAVTLTVTPASIALSQLDSVQLVPSFLDRNGALITGVNATFSSSDAAIVSVSSSGIVTSLGPAGSTTVTVRGAGLSRAVPVTVQGVASTLVVSPNPAAIAQKGNLQLQARLLDRVGAPISTASFVYASSNPAILTVSATGLLTSVGPAGAAAITVRTGDFATTVQVAVTQVATKLVLLPLTLRLGAGRSSRIASQILDAVDVPMSGLPLRYSSIHPAIVTVDSTGLVTSIGPLGMADIKVEVLGSALSATMRVDVHPAASPGGATADTIPFGTNRYGYAAAFVSSERAIVVQPFAGFQMWSVDLRNRVVNFMQGGDAAYDVRVTRDGKIAFLTMFKGSLRDIDLSTGVVREFNLNEEVIGLALSPDERIAYIGAGGALLVFDITARIVVDRIAMPVLGTHVTVDAAGTRAYVSSGSLFISGEVIEVDLVGRRVARGFIVPRGQATAVSVDGSTLYVASESGSVYQVALETGAVSQLAPTPTCGSWGLGLTPDNLFLYLSCPGQGSIAILDLQTRQVVRTFTGLREPRRVAVRDDGLVVLVASLSSLVVIR